MDKAGVSRGSKIRKILYRFLRNCMCFFISLGPVHNHVGFIMDGSRRYAKRKDLAKGAGHQAGCLVLMSMLKYSYELGIKYVTVYTFSIDNFKRSSDEVHSLLALIQKEVEGFIKEDSVFIRYGIRVQLIGNLQLLDDSMRSTAERVMLAAAGNSKAVLSIRVAYTSTNEIAHAVQESCKEKGTILGLERMKRFEERTL